MENQTTVQLAAEKPKVFRMTLQGKQECICLGKELVRGLGTPAYVKLLVSENYDELVFTPCNEKEVMSFKVPAQNKTNHAGMRIFSKAFVHEVLDRNHLDKTKTHAFYGTYMTGQPAIVFPLKPEEKQSCCTKQSYNLIDL